MRNIGIDIDGVLTSPYYWLSLFNKLTNNSLKEEDCNEYDLVKLFNADESIWNKVMGEYIEEYFDAVDIIENVNEMIIRLDYFNNSFFITARSDTSYIRMRTEDYLKENDLDHIPLHMLGSHNKVSTALELGIDVFVEDNPNNALELAEAGIKVYLINTNYNQNVKHENIIRVNDFMEFYLDILRLEDWHG